MKNRDLKKQLAAAIAMTIVATVALGSSTYAWFVSNSEVTAGPATLTASGTNTLVISQDDGSNIITGNGGPQSWATTMVFEQKNVELQPVSTVGNKTESKPIQFFAASGTEGFSSDTENDIQRFNALKFSDISYNNKESQGTLPYLYDKFYIKSSQAGDLQFSITIPDGEQNELIKTLRLALVVNDTETYFYQFEKTENNNITDTYHNSTHTLVGDADGVTAAISSIEDKGDINNQGVATSYEANGTIVNLEDKKIPTITVALKDEDLFNNCGKIKANTEVMVDAYVWMEGCDYECVVENLVNLNSSLFNLNLKFECEPESTPA